MAYVKKVFGEGFEVIPKVDSMGYDLKFEKWYFDKPEFTSKRICTKIEKQKYFFWLFTTTKKQYKQIRLSDEQIQINIEDHKFDIHYKLNNNQW